MRTASIFQSRPLGESTGSYALTRKDVAELIADMIYFKDVVEGKAETEDFDGEARIVAISSFSNGVKATLELNDWLIDQLVKRPELRQLEIEGVRYEREHQNATFRPAVVQ